MTRKSLSLILALAGTLAACDSHPLAANAPGKIYYRVVQDYSSIPSGTNLSSANCLSASSYSDNNPGVPASPSAHMTGFVGPLQAGEYSAQFNFSGSTSPIQFTYYLNEPEAGKDHYYTQVLKAYSNTLNRCIFGGPAKLEVKDK